MTEGREESEQLNPTQIQGTIAEDKFVALRTRRCRQETVPISTNDGKGNLFQATHQEPNNEGELIRQLKTKIKEQEYSIRELTSAVECFLKIQTIVKKLQVNISKISNHVVPQDKLIKVTVPKINDPEIVEPFTTSLKKQVGTTKHKPTMSKEAKAEMDRSLSLWFPGRVQDTSADTTKHPMTSEKK